MSQDPMQCDESASDRSSDRQDWFERLTGFRERSPDQVRESLTFQGNMLSSQGNGRCYQAGKLEVVSLKDLRKRVAALGGGTSPIRLRERVGDARELHVESANAGATFQVASQFNLLEMVSPEVTPDRGVGIYERDRTQGPACAIACGAGTIVRNYFVELDGKRGQSGNRQIDCLQSIGQLLGNGDGRLWEMRNGYALPSQHGLDEVDRMIAAMSTAQRDELRSKLAIGVQWSTQVTLQQRTHLVTQVYCSALPVAYSRLPTAKWERFARLILEAAYESTLAVGALNASQTGNRDVFLTLLGGGAFGNERQWILDAIERACRQYRSADLDVQIVSFRSSDSSVRSLVQNFAVDEQPIEDKKTPTGEWPDHHCPVCGASQRSVPRYPWYLCSECLGLAEDGDGRRLTFGNVSFSGGLYYAHADKPEPKPHSCLAVICFVNRRPVIVTEARFGGVVAQPLRDVQDGVLQRPQTVDLRRPARRQ
ncbi:hypothetical protein LOC71_11450 [Rhodopirellula sp. JC740]|uniref:Uncharacterized protein n=1 Tax=Rhodopirellula halodulae TaxID=2894198 RepID=A0ABS8NH86_9BACT|nr:hypothetical protein [Rhodopirellula sp. JC740]MCC9642893.1 hypothetical protein [Rhodopirellula sp. JC740]